jgi:hypothetical protein
MTRTMNMSRVSYRDSTSSITPMVSFTFIQMCLLLIILNSEYIANTTEGIKESLEKRTACHLFQFFPLLANYFHVLSFCVLFSTFSCRHSNSIAQKNSILNNYL